MPAVTIFCIAGKWGNLKHVELNKFTVPEHFGTHVDAPAHFHNRPNERIDDVGLGCFFINHRLFFGAGVMPNNLCPFSRRCDAKTGLFAGNARTQQCR